MKSVFLSALLAASLLFSGCATLSIAHTPPEGSPERNAILQATREAAAKQGSTDKKLVVADLKVHNGWAWIQVKPESATKQNRYVSQSGLLQEQGGKWKHLEWMPSKEGTDYHKYFQDLKTRYPATPRDILPQ